VLRVGRPTALEGDASVGAALSPALGKRRSVKSSVDESLVAEVSRDHAWPKRLGMATETERGSQRRGGMWSIVLDGRACTCHCAGLHGSTGGAGGHAWIECVATLSGSGLC